MEPLIQRAQRDERKALRELLLMHRNLIEAIAARFLWDRAAREDIVQNVMVNMVGSIGNFAVTCRFSTWLYRIAVNECIEAN